MIQRIDLRDIDIRLDPRKLSLPRPTIDISVASVAAQDLIDQVRQGGVQALRQHAQRFDHCEPEFLRVPAQQILTAATQITPSVRDALTLAIHRVRKATEAQIQKERVTTLGTGQIIRQRWQPVSRVGLYVPGGKAVYPSSVVMNVVPAQVAGVESIALASPAQREFGGQIHPTILAAASLLGIDEVYAIGGASAIAALAYGVPELGLSPVDVVTGPGNIYVAAAKRLVRGVVGIDAEAGTTEILVIADATADPHIIASDLVSQAEHDEAAASILVTDSFELAENVRTELPRLSSATRHSERVQQALSGQQSAIVLVKNIDDAAFVSNSYAPEHLEIHTADNEATLNLITNAGAIFLGAGSPVSLGDYLAGSNHVLPTGGQVRFSSGLGAYTFLRPQQIIDFTVEGLSELADPIVTLSLAEDLPAHGEAVEARFPVTDITE